jgi:hypothetical protein
MAAIEIRERQFDFGPQRESWQGTFPVIKVLKAAQAKLEYHERRLKHWQAEYKVAADKEQKSIKVRRVQVTGGEQSIYESDQAATQAKALADSKIKQHTQSAFIFREWVAFLDGEPTKDRTPLVLTFSDAQFFGLSGHQPDDSK